MSPHSSNTNRFSAASSQLHSLHVFLFAFMFGSARSHFFGNPKLCRLFVQLSCLIANTKILAQFRIEGIPPNVAIGDSFLPPGHAEPTAGARNTKDWNIIFTHLETILCLLIGRVQCKFAYWGCSFLRFLHSRFNITWKGTMPLYLS